MRLRRVIYGPVRSGTWPSIFFARLNAGMPACAHECSGYSNVPLFVLALPYNEYTRHVPFCVPAARHQLCAQAVVQGRGEQAATAATR